MAGHAVSKYFEGAGFHVRRVTRKEFDIARDPFSEFEKIAEGVDHVVNCAGVIKPLIAQTPIQDVLRVNGLFPKNLAKFSKERGIRCFHLTTDCAYSGLRGAYSEADYFDADDVYGMSKIAGEPLDCMTLRTSIIGEERGQSRSLVSWAQSQAGQTVNGFTNHRWNGVTTLYFAQLIHEILEKNLYQEGLFHLHSPDTVTKAELLGTINEVYGLNLTIKDTNAERFCDRSLTSLYPLSGKIVTKTIFDQVRGMKAFFSR